MFAVVKYDKNRKIMNSSNISLLINRITQAGKLITQNDLSEIDHDILLDDIKQLYTLVKSNTPTTPIRETTISHTKPTPAVEHAPEVTVPPLHDEIVIPPVEIVAVEKKAEEPLFSPPVAPTMAESVTIKTVDDDIAIAKADTSIPPAHVKSIAKKDPAAKASLNEVFGKEERSLNEKLTTEKKPALNDHASRKDLKSLIDLNKQFVLTNELFKGDSAAFNTAIHEINNAPTIEVAFEYIKTDLLPKYKWSGESQSTRLFDKLVRQKFGV